VLWAQRSSKTDAAKNYVHLTLSVPDVAEKDMKLDLQPTKLLFQGHSHTKNVDYKVDLEFFDEIDPKESKISHTDRDIEMVLRKKELKEEYWPRLLKDKAKVGLCIRGFGNAMANRSAQAHFLKTNFDKWVDEDEQDANPDDEFMNNYGALGQGGPGAGGDGGFGNIDFSKLGAGPGGPSADFPEESDDEEPDDDDMPDLEGEEKKEEIDTSKIPVATTGASKKIEEVE
jgi:CS domain